MHQFGMYTAMHMVVIGALKDTYYDPDEKRAVLSYLIEFLFSPFFQGWVLLLNRANEAGYSNSMWFLYRRSAYKTIPKLGFGDPFFNSVLNIPCGQNLLQNVVLSIASETVGYVVIRTNPGDICDFSRLARSTNIGYLVHQL